MPPRTAKTPQLRKRGQVRPDPPKTLPLRPKLKGRRVAWKDEDLAAIWPPSADKDPADAPGNKAPATEGPAPAPSPAVGAPEDVEFEDAAADTTDDDTTPLLKSPVGKGKTSKGQTGKGSRAPRQDYSLPRDVEEQLYDWLANHEEVWRPGHRDYYSKRRDVIQAKATELGITSNKLYGWYKTKKDWYVRITAPLKPGEFRRPLTDREKDLIDRFAFYTKARRHPKPHVALFDILSTPDGQVQVSPSQVSPAKQELFRSILSDSDDIDATISSTKPDILAGESSDDTDDIDDDEDAQK